MTSRKELIDTLSALVTDYSALITERREADNLYFSESVPQPTIIKKSDKSYFQISDCEKIIAGNYKLNGENITGKSSDDSVELTYHNDVEKVTVNKPPKKVPVKPSGPECNKIFTRPLFVVLSAGTFLLSIIGIILLGVGTSLPSLSFLILAIGIVGTFILCGLSKGGIFRLIINLVRLPKLKKVYANELERYKSDLAQYISDMETAQIEYDNSLREYERQIALAEKEYDEKCRKLHGSALLEIQGYIGACKDYFARKEETEAELEKKKAEIKTKYDAVALKIKSYPDTMPPKFLKVSEFECTSCYTLDEIKSELQAYIDILESGRADTLKEATNCYIADRQAEEQRRILEQQAEDARRREEERNRILEEQAEEQRRYNEEQMRFNEQQADEQRRFNQQRADEERRRGEEQMRFNEQQAEEQRRQMQKQADEQKKLAQMQACATSTCPMCRRKCGMASYIPAGHSGCACFIKQ